MAASITGRLHPESPSRGRTEAQRDHDRILYSSAFQRLGGITQISSAEVGQQLHTRLTHSLKVAQVARRLAERLGLSPDSQEIASAASLAHDIGHPPFGHVAEEELNAGAAEWGGFEGNAQSFRILTKLAVRDLRYRGLNLTAATLNGVLKYPWLRGEGPAGKESKWGAYESERKEFEWVREGFPHHERTPEAELMDWADDVTYAVHDLEDFYRVGLIPLDRLSGRDERDRFYASFFERGASKAGALRRKFADFTVAELDDATSFLLDQAFADVPPYRGSRPERAWIRAQTSFLIDWFVNGVSLRGGRVVIQKERLAEIAVLKEIAWYYIIGSPALGTIQYGQRRVIRDLHELYIKAADDPKRRALFPTAQRELLDRHSGTPPERRRVATDFIASLTEDMAFELHHRLTGVSRGSLLDAAALASR
jgi:dGTPase